jgi:hypothetical protein
VVHVSASASRLCRERQLHLAPKKTQPRTKWSKIQATPAQNNDKPPSRTRSRFWRPFLLPIRKGQRRGCPSPVRELMALDRVCRSPAGRSAGHLSGNDRAARCPTGKIPTARANGQVGQGRWALSTVVKDPYIDANLRRANNLDTTIVEITGGMLRAARSLTGLSQQELADRASNLASLPDSSGGIERQRSQRWHACPASRRLGVGSRRHRVSAQRRFP